MVDLSQVSQLGDILQQGNILHSTYSGGSYLSSNTTANTTVSLPAANISESAGLGTSFNSKGLTPSPITSITQTPRQTSAISSNSQQDVLLGSAPSQILVGGEAILHGKKNKGDGGW